jgi:predicted SnoaL-like aldol condensation-catalyzing enzyme
LGVWVRPTGDRDLGLEMELTERNRVVVLAFADVFYRQKDVRRAFTEYVAEAYVQHNPNIPDGRDEAIAALEPKFSNPDAVFDIKRVLVDGDLALVHVHARMSSADAGGAVADIFRLEDERIVEHWDVLQPVPADALNPHPMF